MLVETGRHIVVLGTGGTIAGTGTDPDKAWQYKAAQLPIEQLINNLPELDALAVRCEQIAQIDSKDMNWSVWQSLTQAVQRNLGRDDVAAVVITHGTDTLEETAYLLHCLHDGAKPIVLTAAMRPATAVDADGPRNLIDALRLAQWASDQGQGGVAVVMAGRAWAAQHVRKAHSHALDAFDGGGEQALCVLSADGHVEDARAWAPSGGAGWHVMDAAHPPRVEIITSHVDADGALVKAIRVAMPDLEGIVVACTGHGTVNAPLEAALQEAQQAGITVWRSSRVARGGVQPRDGDAMLAVEGLTAAQARVALVLHELGARFVGT